jgi:hypothetical protein
MSSKPLKTATILALSALLLMCTVAGPAMAKTKTKHSVIHSVMGYFDPSRPWNTSLCSWYGPGLYWNHCKDGLPLLPPGGNYFHLWAKHPNKYVYLGVATLSEPMPQKRTWVELDYRGAIVVVPVVDQGDCPPRMFDLTAGTVQYLNWEAHKLHLKHYVPYSGVPLVKWRFVNRL